MDKIAIVSPCILPVPANLGGAVEELITRIIKDNDAYGSCIIDLYAIDFEDGATFLYSYSNVINLKTRKDIVLRDRLLDKYYRTIPRKGAKRLLDKIIVGAFLNRIEEINGEYDAVIIENMMSTACEIVRACKGKYDFPIYFHMHNDVDIYRSPERIRELVRSGVQFIAVSDYIKRQILKHDRNAIVSVLYNGVDLEAYDRESHRKEGDKISVLYAGRIIPGKGVKELVLAFIQAVEAADDEIKSRLQLNIVGFSGFDRKYEKVVRDLADKHQCITCTDQKPAGEMSSIYNEADIVVMPTIDEEPFGLVALETMAKGIPLIVTDSGALPEVVGDGSCICSRIPNIVNNLTKTIVELASDDDHRKELSDRGYKRARSIEAFDIRNYYSGFMKLINADKVTSDDKISVIVPVYNVSKYLNRCVKSIIDQTYINTEIILIDDGSTDGSGALCDELKASDSRIEVIHQDNMGLSGARNTGLDNATGKYIIFCDSDDFLLPETFDKMLSGLKWKHCDIIACGFTKVYEDDGNCNPREVLFTDTCPGIWSGHESVIQMMRSNNVCTVAWNKLYKKSLFEGIRFPVGDKNEDEATVYKLLYKAGIVSYIPDPLYKYCQRGVSIMHEDLEGRYRFFLKAAEDRIRYFADMGEGDLEQHSRITLLEWIKYSYRNIHDNSIKKELVGVYKDNINFDNAPAVMGKKKRMALLLWKYFRY